MEASKEESKEGRSMGRKNIHRTTPISRRLYRESSIKEIGQIISLTFTTFNIAKLTMLLPYILIWYS
jgi:hypothetical protein